jgi:hypothetical protein
MTSEYEAQGRTLLVQVLVGWQSPTGSHCHAPPALLGDQRGTQTLHMAMPTITVLEAAWAGATICGICGWLYLTKACAKFAIRSNRQVIDRYIDELWQARATGEKAKTAMNEGRRLLTDVTAVQEFA